jgi:starch synthase
MPRFGCINERRNQLHEVIRLSGMNLIIDDTDHPLIIKVASIQAARMQVYFIDNEDYFHRKAMVKDTKNKFFADNDERAIFFARGVIETVKKLQWAPDLIHCQGWFTGLIPLYIKKYYHDDPLFMDSKIVTSLYNDEYSDELDKRIIQKFEWDGFDSSDVEVMQNPGWENLMKLAINFSDGMIQGSETINSDIRQYIEDSGKPLLNYQNEETYIKAYSDFYDKILS